MASSHEWEDVKFGDGIGKIPEPSSTGGNRHNNQLIILGIIEGPIAWDLYFKGSGVDIRAVSG
jgi:hypothetical protein